MSYAHWVSRVVFNRPLHCLLTWGAHSLLTSNPNAPRHPIGIFTDSTRERHAAETHSRRCDTSVCFFSRASPTTHGHPPSTTPLSLGHQNSTAPDGTQCGQGHTRALWLHIYNPNHNYFVTCHPYAVAFPPNGFVTHDRFVLGTRPCQYIM